MRTLAIIFAVAIGGACSKSAPASKTPVVNDPVPMATTTTTPSAQPSSATPSSATDVLASYERVRAALAADDITPVPAAARELEAAARASAASNGHFGAIAEGAGKLAGAADIKSARAAFGNVSQHLVALLASDKSLASGQHIFECPMVTGYNKWVQPTKDLENPYMGKRMLTCGGESSWE